MARKSGGAHERRHLRRVCSSSASARDRGPERNGGICGLPLQRGGLADNVAVIREIVRVRQLVSRRRDIGSARVDCVDSSKETRHLRSERAHCLSLDLRVPRPELLPVAERRCNAIRHATLLNEYCRTVVDTRGPGVRIFR